MYFYTRIFYLRYRFYDIIFFIKWKEKEKQIQQKGFYNDVHNDRKLFSIQVPRFFKNRT